MLGKGGKLKFGRTSGSLCTSTLCPLSKANEDAYVANIIDQENRAWNATFVRNLFGKHNAEIICQIPLKYTNTSDRQIGSATPSGVFTVRSAYHLYMNKIALARGECSRKR